MVILERGAKISGWRWRICLSKRGDSLSLFGLYPRKGIIDGVGVVCSHSTPAVSKTWATTRMTPRIRASRISPLVAVASWLRLRADSSLLRITIAVAMVGGLSAIR